jgi:hypothetical protein
VKLLRQRLGSTAVLMIAVFSVLFVPVASDVISRHSF